MVSGALELHCFFEVVCPLLGFLCLEDSPDFPFGRMYLICDFFFFLNALDRKVLKDTCLKAAVCFCPLFQFTLHLTVVISSDKL